MSNPPDPTANPHPPDPDVIEPLPDPPEQQPRRGCLAFLGRLLMALLVVLMLVPFAVAGTAAVASFLGFSQRIPVDLRRAQQDIATVQAAQAAQATGIAEVRRAASTNNEQIETLDQQLLPLQTDVAAVQRDVQAMQALADELRAGTRDIATAQAQVQQGLLAVDTVGTAQAAQAQQLDELAERTARLTRFLDQLSAITSGIGGSTPTATPTPPATTRTTAAPTPTPPPTTPSPTGTPATDTEDSANDE